MSNILRFFYLILLVIILLFGPTSIARADAPNNGNICKSGYLTLVDTNSKSLVVQGVFYLNDIAAIGGESPGYLLSVPGKTYALELPAGMPRPGSPGSPLVNGDCVRIKGSLERIKGVEGPDRTIVKVTSVESAK